MNGNVFSPKRTPNHALEGHSSAFAGQVALSGARPARPAAARTGEARVDELRRAEKLALRPTGPALPSDRIAA